MAEWNTNFKNVLAIAQALQDQNELSQSQKRGGIKNLLKCMYMVDKPPT